MSIDEAIAQEKELSGHCKRMFDDMNEVDKLSNKLLKNEIEYHEQLAEWLEELKAIKSDGFTDDLLNMWFTKGYSKALNDVESEFLMCDKVHYNLQDILCVINKLKAGGKNETN